MIYTGNYKNCKQGNLISISGDGGKKENFNGARFKELAPKLAFWEEWHNNIGKISEWDNNDFYIREYYKQVLKFLTIESVLRELGQNSVLLCYEDINEFCHRHIASAWIELETGIVVPEISILENGNIKILSTENKTKNRAKILIRNQAA